MAVGADCGNEAVRSSIDGRMVSSPEVIRAPPARQQSQVVKNRAGAHSAAPAR